MPDQDDLDQNPPQAKRTGRDSADARNQPAEFADDMVTNRFEPPPAPGEKDEER